MSYKNQKLEKENLSLKIWVTEYELWEFWNLAVKDYKVLKFCFHEVRQLHVWGEMKIVIMNDKTKNLCISRRQLRAACSEV